MSYQLVFISNFILCFSAMKIISWFMTSHEIKEGKLKNFMFSPYFSVRSLGYHFALPHPKLTTLKKFIFFLSLTALSVVVAKKFLFPLSLFETMLFAPAVYFSTEALGALGQLLFITSPTFTIHRSPLWATTLSNFWGRDWNLWVQDWLRDATQYMAKGKKSKRIIMVFIISGLFHEVMINLPYWIRYHESYFGTMIAYFMIQSLALWFDKNYAKTWSKLQRKIYMWIAIIVPSPLFINTPLLSFFGLSHE